MESCVNVALLSTAMYFFTPFSPFCFLKYHLSSKTHEIQLGWTHLYPAVCTIPFPEVHMQYAVLKNIPIVPTFVFGEVQLP